MRLLPSALAAALLLAGLPLAGCADDAAPAAASSVVPLPAAPPVDTAAAPAEGADGGAADPALAAFWSGFQAAVATGRDEAVLPHLQFPLVVAGETVERGDYASSLAAGLWGDESIAAAVAALTPADLVPDGDGVRFTARTETVADGEKTESAVIGWIGRTPEGAWKVTRLDLAG